MTRFVVDCETLLRIAAGELEVAAEHQLVAPTLVPVAEAPPWLLEWVQKERPARQPGLKLQVPANGRPDARARAIAYLEKCPPAISGQGGHDRTFEVAAMLEGEQVGHGEGRSKKTAEQAAAEEAFERLGG